MGGLWKREATLSRRKKKRRRKRKAKKREEEKLEEGGSTSRSGLGRSWPLSMTVTPEHTQDSMRCELLQCKQEERIWAFVSGLWN